MIIVPVLARPHRVEPLLASIWEATPEPHRVLFVADRTDRDELAAIEAAGAEVEVFHHPDRPGTYPEKINAGYRASTEPILFLAADDVTFHVGWLAEIHRALAHGAKVVGTNDLGNKRTISGEHSTHTAVLRSYADRPGGPADRRGAVLHEGYRHWFCDDELVGVARHRRVWAHCPNAVVEHLHPYHGKAERDATYDLGEANERADRVLFRKRRRLWRA